MIVYNAKVLFIIESEHVCTNYVSWSYQDVVIYHLPLRLCMLKSKACGTIFIKCSMSLIMLGQYIDSCTRSFVFSAPMWLMWSWSSTCAFSHSGMMIQLPFIMTPSISAKLSLDDQDTLMSWDIWSLLSGILQWYTLLPAVNAHLVQLPAVSAGLTGIQGHLLMFVFHPPLCPCHVLLHFCSPCHSVGTANLWWICPSPACTGFWPSIDECWGGCEGYAVTGLLYLS